MEPVRKVFIGLNNIASQIPDFAQGFESLGIDTFTVSARSKPIVSDRDVDIVLEDRIPRPEWFQDQRRGQEVRAYVASELTRYVWEKAVAECDTFFFMHNTFRPDFSDLAELKRLGKRIITYFVGDDVRWYPAMTQEFSKYGMPPIEYDPGYYRRGDLPMNKLQYLRLAERYADVIYSQPDRSQLALRPYNAMRFPLQLSMFSESVHRRERPLVVHAPSSGATKGTKYILPVIEQLQREGLDFDFELVQNLPYREAIARYEAADVLVAQVMCPGGGKQEREALACGTVVMSSSRPQYPQVKSDEFPVIDIDVDSLYEKLKRIVTDHDYRVEVARLGRPFVEKDNDVRGICEVMLQDLESPRTDYHYRPTFFREEFVPETAGVSKLYNEYTKLVQGCDWYGENVEAGRRGELIF